MYQVDLEVYQGPFDLLLDLIDSQQIDIWDIPIARIARQYLAELQRMQELDLTVGSEFLVMAATLLEIKAKMLLPTHDRDTDESEEEDPREALVARLLEYKMYKEIAGYFKDQEQALAGCLTRGWMPEQADARPMFTNPVGVSLDRLVRAFSQVLEAAQSQEAVQEIQRRISLEERIGQLRLRFAAQSVIPFSQLFEHRQRWDMIVTFLAILELIRVGELRGRQRGTFAEIRLELIGKTEEWSAAYEG